MTLQELFELEKIALDRGLITSEEVKQVNASLNSEDVCVLCADSEKCLMKDHTVKPIIVCVSFLHK